MRRRWRNVLAVVAGVLALAAGAGVAAWRLVLDEPGSVSNPDVPFASSTAPEEDEEPQRQRGRPDRFVWPLYGYYKAHRRFFQPRRRLRGPWRQMWRHRATALLEFPPVIFRRWIFQLADDGRLTSLDKHTGRVRWRRRLGTLSASSPAVGGASVYVALLERRRGSGQGRVVALRMRGGRIRWSRTFSSRTESSPLLSSGRIYVGTEGGTLYALNAHNGRTIWTYRAGGAIKGSPTLSHGKLLFGDYAGQVHAVRLRDGKRVWKVAPARRLVGSGRFYATAAVAFGRVYIGATDGREYSLSTENGRLAWAHQTGGYVYSSAAVANVRGVGPTVFFGSYDGYLYALDARTGKRRWRYRSGGRISGSPTIIGDVVYFADLGRRITIGLRTRDGRAAFRRKPGAFDPIVSDGRYLFQTGRSSLTALLPMRDPLAKRRRRQVLARERARRRARRPARVRPVPCRAPAPCAALKEVLGRRGERGRLTDRPPRPRP